MRRSRRARRTVRKKRRTLRGGRLPVFEALARGESIGPSTLNANAPPFVPPPPPIDPAILAATRAVAARYGITDETRIRSMLADYEEARSKNVPVTPDQYARRVDFLIRNGKV